MTPRANATGWSAWQPVAEAAVVSEEVLAEILDGGQSFRWNRGSDGVWRGTWADNIARLRLGPRGTLQWSAPAQIASRVGTALPRYLGQETDFAALSDALPWRSDAHLAHCMTAFPGLRLLRQPFGETLLGFLCSATKQIVQIKQMVGLLAVRHGRQICRPVGGGEDVAVAAPATWHRLPTWDDLANVPEPALRACLLGFRARYIAETAAFLARHPGWLDETERLPYAQAKERLCALPGVGEKVADCVLLFGAARFDAFPVDVWILKTMARRYGLEGWKPGQLAHFGRVHFGACAGLAQQYLFGWERRFAGRS